MMVKQSTSLSEQANFLVLSDQSWKRLRKGDDEPDGVQACESSWLFCFSLYQLLFAAGTVQTAECLAQVPVD